MKTGRPGPQHLVLLKKDWSARRAAEGHSVTAGFRTDKGAGVVRTLRDPGCGLRRPSQMRG
jgi:hypothetical protein